MKYIWITIIIIFSVFLACELCAIQQFMHLSDTETEEILLKKVKGAVREGKILKLQTNSGSVTFEDRINVGEDSAKYYLAGYSETHGYFYLVRVSGYEGKGYVLVNKKSDQTSDLYGRPVFSPDGKRFVEVSLDLEAGYLPNLVIIYKLDGDEYVKEWEHIYKGVKGPANPVWLNNSSIVFFEVTFDKVPTVSNLTKKPFIIERDSDTWQKPRPLK